MNFNPRANVFYLLYSLAAQIVSLAATFLIISVLDQSELFNEPLRQTIFLILLGASAYLISRWLGMPVAWQAANGLLGPSIVLYELLQLPQIFLAASALILLFLYLPTLWTRVPYYPTSFATYAKLSDLISTGQAKTFIDLGCGSASLLIYLARRHPQVKFKGVEISALPLLISKVRAHLSGLQNLEVSGESFWKIDLSQFDIIYAFLSPAPMPELWQKIRQEKGENALFISNTFEAPAAAKKVIAVNDKRQAQLFMYGGVPTKE